MQDQDDNQSLGQVVDHPLCSICQERPIGPSGLCADCEGDELAIGNRLMAIWEKAAA